MWRKKNWKMNDTITSTLADQLNPRLASEKIGETHGVHKELQELCR